MSVFLANTPTNISLPLVDRAGNPIPVVRVVSWRVTDQHGAEVLGPQVVESFTPGVEAVTVTVPASANTLEVGVPRAGRTVSMTVELDASNLILLTASYGLEAEDPLVVGLNSFQTYTLAKFMALEVPCLLGWEGASDAERVAAMVEARERICLLGFRDIAYQRDMSRLGYEVEYAGPPRSDPMGLRGPVSMADLDAAGFESLSERLKRALRIAQLIQADAVLGGNPADDRRQSGLVLETVGESKQMFRSGKPLDMPVCRRAMTYLAPFITLSKSLGRA